MRIQVPDHRPGPGVCRLHGRRGAWAAGRTRGLLETGQRHRSLLWSTPSTVCGQRPSAAVLVTAPALEAVGQGTWPSRRRTHAPRQAARQALRPVTTGSCPRSWAFRQLPSSLLRQPGHQPPRSTAAETEARESSVNFPNEKNGERREPRPAPDGRPQARPRSTQPPRAEGQLHGPCSLHRPCAGPAPTRNPGNQGSVSRAPLSDQAPRASPEVSPRRSCSPPLEVATHPIQLSPCGDTAEEGGCRGPRTLHVPQGPALRQVPGPQPGLQPHTGSRSVPCAAPRAAPLRPIRARLSPPSRDASAS